MIVIVKVVAVVAIGLSGSGVDAVMMKMLIVVIMRMIHGQPP